jgi:Bacterial protein of unknown function (DUF899)
MTELLGFSAFTLKDGILHQTYSTTGRGVEFLMPYYAFLDRAPKGRDEGEGSQLWLRRHDEYDSAKSYGGDPENVPLVATTGRDRALVGCRRRPGEAW